MSSDKRLTEAEQGAAPDRLQLRSFLAPLSAAGELSRWAAARGVAAGSLANDVR